MKATVIAVTSQTIFHPPRTNSTLPSKSTWNLTTYLHFDFTLLYYNLTSSHNFNTAYTRVYPEVSGLSHNKIYAYIWYGSLGGNTKGYGGKTH
jgi:hypothetical protein